MLHRSAIAVSCALLVLAAAACSSDGKGTAQQTPTTAARRTTTTRPAHPTTTRPSAPTTAGITVPPPAALSDLILGTGPPGFEQQADDVGDTGPTDLDKAAEDDNSDTARSTLLAAGFQDGYQRQWTSVDATTNSVNQDFVFLYRFATPEGAQSWVQHWRLNLITTNTSKTPIQFFTPPEIPDAIGMSAVNAQQGSTGVVLYNKGPYAVESLVVGAPGVDQSEAASDMALAQYQHLP